MAVTFSRALVPTSPNFLNHWMVRLEKRRCEVGQGGDAELGLGSQAGVSLHGKPGMDVVAHAAR
eukprot:5575853-Amphidinium_carterae.1